MRQALCSWSGRQVFSCFKCCLRLVSPAWNVCSDGLKGAIWLVWVGCCKGWLHHATALVLPDDDSSGSVSLHHSGSADAVSKSEKSRGQPAASSIWLNLRAGKGESQSGTNRLQSLQKKRSVQRDVLPPPFMIPSCTIIEVSMMLGEISVCSLWMHIRRLLMAIRRLWMAVHSLQTEISARSADDFIRHRGAFQHASWTFSSGSPNQSISFHNSGKAFALSYFPLTFAPLNGKRVLGNLFQNKTRL